MQTGIVLLGHGIARSRDDADLDVLTHEIDHARDHRASRLQALAIIIQRDVSVESSELEGALGSYGHELGRIEDEAHIVEGGGDEAARRNISLAVLELEGGLERQPGKEVAYGRDEELELRRDPARV